MKRSLLVLGLIAFLGALLASTLRAFSTRTAWIVNLKGITLALHGYHDVFGRLPDDIRDAEGKPNLSWRVALLPFVEQDSLFKEFHLDEPWDSAHNLPLAKRFVRPYVNFRKANKDEFGFFTYVKGEGTLVGAGPPWNFPGKNLKNAIAVVDLDEDHADYWTKPDIWKYDRADPWGGLEKCSWGRRYLNKDGCFVVTWEGEVCFLTRDANLDLVRALFLGDASNSRQLVSTGIEAISGSRFAVAFWLWLGLGALVVPWGAYVLLRSCRGLPTSPGELMVVILAVELSTFLIACSRSFEVWSGLLPWRFRAAYELWYCPRVATLVTCALLLVALRARVPWRPFFVALMAMLLLSCAIATRQPPGLEDVEALVNGLSLTLPLLSIAMLFCTRFSEYAVALGQRRLAHLAGLCVNLVPLAWQAVWVYFGRFNLTTWSYFMAID
ncbi:MAG: DUF1559 domain-containing protein [Planctomycetes bacterium]|nr:DUF1559 domain-containing protein [Planctomycetota bacterium]